MLCMLLIYAPLKWYLSLPEGYMSLSKPPWLLFCSKVKIPQNELGTMTSGPQVGEKNSKSEFYLGEDGHSESWIQAVEGKSLWGVSARIGGLICLTLWL